MSKLVAVYGTLKKGEGNHHLMEMSGAEHVITTVTQNLYVMFDGCFPMVNKPAPGMDGLSVPITVEVFKVKDLELLDHLEGHPDFFCREQVEVEGLDERPWMYIAPEDHGREETVASGNWQDTYPPF